MSTKTEMDTFYPEQPRKIDLKNSKDQYWTIFEFDGIQIGRIELGSTDKAGMQRLGQARIQVTLTLFDKNDSETHTFTETVDLHALVRNDMIQPFLDVNRFIDKPHISEYATRNALYWTLSFEVNGLELLNGETLSMTVTTIAK